MWSYSSYNKITHDQGHSIVLNAGTWYSPKDLHPTIASGTKALDAARLIREGLAFAESFPYAQQPLLDKPKHKKVVRVSNRKILSLKKS